MALHTILGAGGAMANSLLDVLTAQRETVRLVGRNVHPTDRAQTIQADATNVDQLKTALDGSAVVYLLVGLPYSAALWAAQWPPIMANTIEVCKQIGARLVYFDNVYMYGLVDGPQTEDTPFNPASKKGEIRTRIVEQLYGEMKTGSLSALIGRSADFYGPYGTLQTSLVKLLIISNLAKGEPAQWFGSGEVTHSFSFTTDMAQALYTLQADESAFGQTWHLPTAPNPPTIAELVQLAAPLLDAKPDLFVIGRAMVESMMADNPMLTEIHEMLYQYEKSYLFDSSKFNRAYNFTPTDYAEGIRQAVIDFRDRPT